MTTVVGWVVHVIIVSAQVQIIGFLDLLGQGIRDFDLGLTISLKISCETVKFSHENIIFRSENQVW